MMVKMFTYGSATIQDIRLPKILLFCPNNGHVWEANVRIVIKPVKKAIDIDSLTRYIDQFSKRNIYQEELSSEIFAKVQSVVGKENYEFLVVIIDGKHYSVAVDNNVSLPAVLRTVEMDYKDEKAFREMNFIVSLGDSRWSG